MWKIQDEIANDLYAFGFFMLLWAILKDCWQVEIAVKEARESLRESFTNKYFRFKLTLGQIDPKQRLTLLSFRKSKVFVPVSKQKTLNRVFERKRCSLPSRLKNHHQNDYIFYTNTFSWNCFAFDWNDGRKTRREWFRCLQSFNFSIGLWN